MNIICVNGAPQRKVILGISYCISYCVVLGHIYIGIYQNTIQLSVLLQCTSGNRGTSGPHLAPRFPSAICVWSYGVDLSASAPVFGSGLYIQYLYIYSSIMQLSYSLTQYNQNSEISTQLYTHLVTQVTSCSCLTNQLS